MFLFILYWLTRIVNISQLPIFNDEAFFISAIRRILADPASNLFINFTDGKEPLFFWVYTLPVKFSPDALLGIRLFSAVLGFLGLVYTQKLAKKFSVDQNLAGLVYVFSPFLLFYNRIGMQETLLTFLLIAATYYLVRSQKILAGVFMGLALLTKTSALAYLIPLLFFKRNKVSVIIAVLMFVPIIWGYGSVMTHNQGYFGLISPNEMFINFKMAVRWLWEYQGIMGVMGVMLPPVWLEILGAKIFFPRYFLFVMPILVIVVAKLLRPLRWLMILLIPNIILCGQIIWDVKTANLPYIEKYQYVESWAAGYGIKETAQFLKSQNIKEIITEDVMITKNGLEYYYPELKINSYSDQEEGTFVFKKSHEIANALKLNKVYNSFDVAVYRSHFGSQ